MSVEYVSAAEAAEFLDVKRQTLYAYVSRGWLTSIPDPSSNRARLYARADLERLRARSDAKSGDGPVAAAALRWGAPVLETRICRVTSNGPELRGFPLVELLDRNFEDVVALLWEAELAPWPAPAPARLSGAFIDRIRLAVLHAETGDPLRDVPTPGARLAQGQRLLSAVADGVGGKGKSIAERINNALGGRKSSIEAVNRGLIICAEHELNASAFAARVAASTSANLYAAVSAALATFVGPKHGGASRRIHRLLAEAESRGARQALLERLQAAEELPGFGHTLYPDGDPRFDMLMDCAGPDDALAELLEAAAELGLEAPNLDMGLVALCRAAKLAPDAESVIFAVGRTAGWVAHAMEQAQQGFLLRPRANFVG